MKKEYKIHIDISEKKLFYEEFDDELFSKELSDYIMRRINKIPLRGNVRLEFESSNLTDEERKKFKRKFKDYYQSLLDDNKIFSNMCLIRNLFMIIVGILLIACNYYFSTSFEPILLEIVMIIGWVMIWEVVYDFLFSNNRRRYEVKRIKQLLKAKIVFAGD